MRTSNVPIGSPQHREMIEALTERFSQSTMTMVHHISAKTRGVFPLCQYLAIGAEEGQDRTPQYYRDLYRSGVRHILRLRTSKAKTPRILAHARGYPQVDHLPTLPQRPLDLSQMRELIQHIHEPLHARPDPRILVQCWKGRERSATAVWLYLVALGFSPEAADRAIFVTNPDADPAQKPLVWRHESLPGQLQNTLKSFRSDLFETLFPHPWPAA